MSNQNDQAKHSWGDEDETEEPRMFRDAYQDAVNQNRPRPRSNGTPQTPTRRPRGVPGSARIYEETESSERTARPRRARQSREEVEARLRQRPRQPIYTRNRAESSAQPPAQTRRQPRRETTEEEYLYQQPAPTRPPQSSRANPRAPRPYADYEDYDEYEVIQENQRLPQAQKHRRRRARRAFSTILTGCLGGLITLLVVAAVLAFLLLHNTKLGQSLNIGKSAHTQSSTQAVPLSGAGEVLIKDPAGNIKITINPDPNVSTIGLNSVKQVQASSDSDANNQFKQIVLTTKTITQKDDPACLSGSCLLINATVPTAGGGLLGGGSSASVDLNVTLPASFNAPDPTHPAILSASANAGNITVDSFKGVLNLNGNAGNISITHALIFAGTCVQTLHGDVTVNQGSFFDLTQSSKLVPCSNTSSDQQHPWFNIKSGVGNVDITLTIDPTKPLSLLLDANTNDGKITGDFGLNVTTNDGSDTYHGPLLPNTNPTASLYVAASTGNIELRKQ